MGNVTDVVRHFCFSGTGNSRHIAVTSDELVSINDQLRNQNTSALHSDKPLFFAGPVYAGRLPRVMVHHIEETAFTGCHDAYFTVTCAETPYISQKYVEKLAGKKQFYLLGFHSIIMPQSWITGGVSEPKAVNDKIANAAEPDIRETAERINNQESFPKEATGTSFMSRCLNLLMYAFLFACKSDV